MDIAIDIFDPDTHEKFAIDLEKAIISCGHLVGIEDRSEKLFFENRDKLLKKICEKLTILI
jgi:hypothetical protein